MTVALTFPGQGSQQVGMGQALAEAFVPAREVFEEVDEALSQHLSRIMWEGPPEDLTLTENAQPALMAVGMAVFRVLERECGLDMAKVGFVAGHSLGEYSALAAAGTFSLADAARLLKLRGRAMQQAVPVGEGAMAALLGLDLAEAAQVAEEAAGGGEVCQPANDNAPGQVVVSGHREAVERAIEIAKEKGARRAILLPVSAPFHCALMQPAADAMADALAKVTINAPAVPVVANVVASAVSDPDEIRRLLVAQVTGTVRWRECVGYLAGNGVTEVFELGSGKVLAGLAKRIEKSLEATSIGTPDDIEAALAKLA